jgi:hypothetical protein
MINQKRDAFLRLTKSYAKSLINKAFPTKVSLPFPIQSDVNIQPLSQFCKVGDSVVPVSTVGTFHNSIGDISTAQATQNFLVARGIPSYLTSFWDNSHKTIVIGGGQIIGFPEKGSWQYVKPLFLPDGEHILNAVGVDLETISEAKFRHLKNYRYVSVRDNITAEIISDFGIDVVSVPCPATLQFGLPLELIKGLPKYQITRQLEAKSYIVIHKHPKLIKLAKYLEKKGHVVVVVDMQVHAQHRWGNTGIIIPSTHSPEIIKGLVDSASAVFTSSLHLAIFAISAGCRFGVVSGKGFQEAKVYRYLQRAGLGELMGLPEELPEIAEANEKHIKSVSAVERQLALAHLRTIEAKIK